MDWFRDIIGAGVPCGPINTIDQGVAFAEEIGLDPVVTVGEGAAAVPSVRNPITFSATEAELPAAAADARRARDGDPALAGRGPGGALRMSTDDGRLSFPTSLGTSTADEIRLLGQDLTADLMGKVGFGELAFWLVTHAPAHPVGDAGLRGGAGRPGRPRLHPHGDRRPADLPVGPGLAAGRAGRRPARRRIAVPRRDRGLRRVPARRPGATRTGRCPPTTPAGTPSRWRR